MHEDDEIIVIDDEPVEETEVKEKKTRTKKGKEKEEVATSPVNFQEKLFNLANDVAELANDFVKDGYNPSQSYEYVRAQQYKTVFRKALRKNRLRHKIDDAVCNINNLEKSDKMILTLYHGILTIKDVDSDEQETYMIWSEGADNLDKGLSKAKTLALKDFVKLNYLVSDNEDDPEADPRGKSTTAPKKFVTPSENKKLVEGVVTDKAMAPTEVITRFKDAIKSIRVASGDETYGEKVLNELESPVTSARATVILTKLEMKAEELDITI